MAAETSNDAKNKARNQKRADKLMQDGDAKPALKLVEGRAPLKEGGAGAFKGEVLKTKDLIDMVAAGTGAKKADLRQIIEATLEAIGKSLATGIDMNIPPLGKLRVAKNASPVMTLKLRLADGPRAAGLALADTEEDS